VRDRVASALNGFQSTFTGDGLGAFDERLDAITALVRTPTAMNAIDNPGDELRAGGVTTFRGSGGGGTSRGRTTGAGLR
jgi:hypothetical protein